MYDVKETFQATSAEDVLELLEAHPDAVLVAGVKQEGGPLNRAPRNSVLAELLTLQALSVALQVEKDWDPVKYVRCHPGGKLGQLRDNEKK